MTQFPSPTPQRITTHMRTSTENYLNQFVSSSSAENLVGLFSRTSKPGKEITESWAMLEAAFTYVSDLEKHLVVVAGDGNTPRTAALFAYFAKADTISIDPIHNLDFWVDHCRKQAACGFPVQRIRAIAGKIEDTVIDCEGKPVLVVWPHSHAPMNSIRLENHDLRSDIAMPCCVPIPSNFLRIPHIAYEDFNVLSPHRRVHVWSSSVVKALQPISPKVGIVLKIKSEGRKDKEKAAAIEVLKEEVPKIYQQIVEASASAKTGYEDLAEDLAKSVASNNDKLVADGAISFRPNGPHKPINECVSGDYIRILPWDVVVRFVAHTPTGFEVEFVHETHWVEGIGHTTYQAGERKIISASTIALVQPLLVN